MFLNNSFNILPWYDSLEKQSSKKWYTFGQSWPLLCPKGTILPFQFVCEALEVTSNIQAVNISTNEITDLGVAPSVIQGSQPNSTYYIVKLASVAVPALSVGTYYLRFKTSLGYLYSEEITVIDDSNECIKVQYWNEDTLNFASGEINFADDFKFEFYIRSTIGKPEYEFEEELTKRLGYKFIESQTSNKVYKFAFVAPEYICDAMRLIRLCDYIKLTTKFDSYNALSFAYEPKWQDQGDLAAIDVEFDTDCIIQKLESFNRRIKESFYNALLADIDEPVLFSADTVAQYYTEFTTTSFINGKSIRQLESILPNELQLNFADLVLPIDNMADDKNTAKKVSLPDLMSLAASSDISKLFKGHFDADGNLQWIEALAHLGVNGGVTMFIDNGTMSLPQLYAGLPIDGNTLIRDENGVLMVNPDLKFGGGASSWGELEGKPDWITNTKPIYDYSEIKGTPDLSKYALSEDLKKYVSLDGNETINGLKNFTKGLQIDGLSITKPQDDVIYLDANLVVRGGITMYGINSVDVPTIMDAIATDNVNLKVVNGVLTFVGQTGGGVADSVLWDNIEGKPSWIGSSKPSYSYSEISGTPTLLSSFIDDVVAGNYLPMSGGILTGALTIKAESTGATPKMKFQRGNTTDAYYDAYIYNIVGGITIGTSAGGVDTDHLLIGATNMRPLVDNRYAIGRDDLRFSNVYSVLGNFKGQITSSVSDGVAPFVVSSTTKIENLNADLLDGHHYDDIINGNVASATKLAKNIELWGQVFNGSSSINGSIYINNTYGIVLRDSNNSNNTCFNLSGSNVLHIGEGTASKGYKTTLNGNSIEFKYGSSPAIGMILNSSGGVTIGSSDLAGTSSKLYVNGNTYINGQFYLGENDVSGSVNLMRAGANYIWANATGGQIHLGVADKGTNSAANATLTITASQIHSGSRDNEVSLGTSSYRWSDIHSVLATISEKVTINNIPIYKSQDDVLYIDGNLAVRGGITMYATDAIDVPSIIDALPSATYDTKGISAFNPNDFSVVDGYVSFIGKGGVDESVLAQYAKKVDLDYYLLRRGGTIEGLLSIMRTPSVVSYKDGYGNLWGYIGFNAANNPCIFYNDSSTQFTILHSGNWSQYVTAGDGGNYLPLSGGTINGSLTVLSNTVTDETNTFKILNYEDSPYGLICGINANGNVSMQVRRESNKTEVFNMILQPNGGNVGVGVSAPNAKMHIGGDMIIGGWVSQHQLLFDSNIPISVNNYTNARIGAFDRVGGLVVQFGTGGNVSETKSFSFIDYAWQIEIVRIESNGNIFTQGGITMYSDIRKKTKLQDVELTLQQIAEAPLIEHYYNSDTNKTTHVGSIAQYWAGLNDWFCKLDGEGYYTMEIQNAALASAISIARELQRYESKTDRKIRLLKKRIGELEDKIEELEKKGV